MTKFLYGRYSFRVKNIQIYYAMGRISVYSYVGDKCKQLVFITIFGRLLRFLSDKIFRYAAKDLPRRSLFEDELREGRITREEFEETVK